MKVSIVPSFLQRLVSPVLLNTLSLVLLRGVLTLSRMAVLLLLAYFVAPAQLGVIAFVVGIAEVAKVIADFGVSTLVIRDYTSINVLDQRRLMNVALTARIVCGIAAYICSIGFFFVTLGLEQLPIAGVVSLIILSGLFVNLSVDYFQALLQINKVVWVVVGTNVVGFFFIVVTSLMGMSLVFVVSLLPLTEFISGYLLFERLRRTVEFVPIFASFSKVINLLRRSVPLGVTTIIVLLYTRLDLVVLKSYLDEAALGYYAVAYRITEPFQLVAGAFAASVYSHVSAQLGRLGKANPVSILKWMLLGGGYGIVSCFILIFCGNLLVPNILPMYTPALPIINFLAVAVIFRSFNPCLTSILLAYGRFARITIIALWNLLFGAILLIWLVPSYGTVGAATALLVVEVSNTCIQLFLVFWSVRGWPNSKVVAQP